MSKYPQHPGWKGGSETSREAADAIASASGRLQRMAYFAICEAGQTGLTADELAGRLMMTRWSIQPRTSELRSKRLIDDSGQRRLNATGKRAIVWVAAPAKLGAPA